MNKRLLAIAIATVLATASMTGLMLHVYSNQPVIPLFWFGESTDDGDGDGGTVLPILFEDFETENTSRWFWWTDGFYSLKIFEI